MHLPPTVGQRVVFRIPARTANQLGQRSGGQDKVTASLEIARIEYLSGDRHVYGTLTGLGEETRVIARLPATITTPLEDGDKRDFAVHERDLRFFDAESGKQTAAQPARA